MLIDQCTLSKNVAKIAGGGIGGAIGPTTSHLIVRNSTISGNKADFGGGIGLDGLSAATLLSLRNSTVTLNETVSGMAGGVGVMGPTGVVTFSSTIIAGNIFGGGPSPTVDVTFTAATPVAGNQNLIGVLEPPTMAILLGFGNLTGTMFFPLDAKLAPLAANGGPTLTHMPAPLSPAIDKGNNVFALATDQRGLGFPRVLGLSADIGAVETISKIITGKGMSGDVLAPGAAKQTVTVTYYDDLAVDTTTLSFGDIEIITPTGLAIPVVYKGVDNPVPGTPRVATYEFVAPGGVWDVSDNGTYTIMQKAFEVFDVTGMSAPAGPIGTFFAAMPMSLVVNATNDEAVDSDGLVSLREAILTANASGPSTDSITFDPVVFAAPQTIPLLLGELPITDSVNIQGPTAASGVTVNGLGTDRHFLIDNPNSNISVEIVGLTLVNGRVVGESGGSIQVTDEALTLRGVTLSDNRADPVAGGNADGGGIALMTSDASLTLIDSVVHFNFAQAGAGGGIFLGETFGKSGSLQIQRSTIDNNIASVGGGIATRRGGSLLIVDSTISNNNSTSTTGGGGIDFSDAFATGSLTIINSTISGNKGVSGGGVSFVSGGIGSNLTIENSTITRNLSTGGPGGGIAVSNPFVNPVTFSSSIVAENFTPAVFVGTADLNFSPANPVSGDNDLIGVMDPVNGALLLGVGHLTGSVVLPLNPGLDPLAFNGGPTQTHRLQPTSPAINKGNNVLGLAFDQRGPGFPRVNGAQADIGAYEAPAPPRIIGFKVNNGAIQRSLVTEIAVTFTEPVNFPNGPSAAFTLARTGPGAPLGLVGLSFMVLGSDVKITFNNSGTAPIEANGSLIDGRYTLTVNSSNVLGPGGTLDGDGDGLSEGPPADDVSFSTHRLFGDSDGNATVNSADFATFRTFFGLGPSIFDYTGDGLTNSNDFAEFRKRFGVTI